MRPSNRLVVAFTVASFSFSFHWIDISGLCRWGEKDANRDLKSLPIARAMLGSLTDVGAPFDFAKWNEGRIITWAPALQEWLAKAQLETHFSITNDPLSAFLGRKADSKPYPGRKGRSLSTSSWPPPRSAKFFPVLNIRSFSFLEKPRASNS